MTIHLLGGFIILVDGQMVAHADTFEIAKSVAQNYVATSSPTASVKISTASSQVVRGVGASPARTWNYDYNLKGWVERVP